MAPSISNLQLTSSSHVNGDDSSNGDFEDVRLLDHYDETAGFGKFSNRKTRTIQVSVGGMTCAACSNSVESALLAVNGVFEASVALLQNKAHVVFDPDLVKVCF